MSEEQKKTWLNQYKDLLDLALRAISLISAVSILLGFGYRAGLGEPFGYSATDLIDGPGDFLIASSDPYVWIIIKLASMVGLFPPDIPYLSIPLAVAFFILYFIFICTRKLTINERKAFINVRLNWLRQKYEKLNLHCLLKPIGHLVGSSVSALIGYYLMRLGALLLCYVLVIIAALIIIVPLAGAGIGLRVAQKQIVDPTECRSYSNLLTSTEKEKVSKAEKKENSKKKTPPQATCLSILKDKDNEIARGKLIHRTSDTLFLYVPKLVDNKKVYTPMSFPIKDAIIESVSTDINEPMDVP